MSDFADLEDDIPDQPEARQDALFGDDDDDDEEDYQPNEGAQQDDDDDDEEADAAPVPEPVAPARDEGKPVDLKAKLAALAAKKREEAADEASGKKKKRRDKGDKGEGSKEGKKRKRDKDKGTRKSSRPKRGEGDDDGDAQPKRRTRDDGPQVSVDSQDIKETDADREFVEDDEVEGEEEKVGSDVVDDDEDDGNGEPPPEAQEAETDDVLFGKKKKKSKQSDAQMQMVVDDKIAKMEAAADMDMEAKADSKPATNKLRFVAEVEEFLAQRKYHELFLHGGGLGVLKAWLEPYADGTLPNVRVRTAVLNACKALPIDTTREDIKDNLKKSQLGSRIMFLAKCPDETQANKRTAIELVQKWSRPIFFDADAEAEKRRIREEQLRRARMQSMEAQRTVEEEEASKVEAQKRIKHGERGYRWHALIPSTSKLDYVVAPARDSTLEAAAQATGTGKKDEGRFAKKMREVQRKQKGQTARAAVPSVEGRSIIF